MARRRPEKNQVLVVGLGRFGSAVAEVLMRSGFEVLGADRDRALVNQMMGRLTHVVQLDSTDAEALQQIGASNFHAAVVGIGTDLESSVLTVTALKDAGLLPERIWAKALSQKHKEILERVGAGHVVQPESDMGRRIARRVVSRALDVLEFEDGFSIAQTPVPDEVVGRTLGEIDFRDRYGIAVVCIKRELADFELVTKDRMLGDTDTLIVAGRTSAAVAFASLPSERADAAKRRARAEQEGRPPA